MNEILKERVEALTEDLRESELTRKQNFSSIAIANAKKIINYCALGALGCELKMIYFDKEEVGNIHEPPYHAIINAYGLDDRLTKSLPVPVVQRRRGSTRNGSIDIEVFDNVNSVITTLNDEARFSFTEIADYIQAIAEAGYIKICSKKRMKAAEEYKLIPDECKEDDTVGIYIGEEDNA